MSCIVCEKTVIRVSTAIPVCQWSAHAFPEHAGTVFFTEKSYIYHIDFKKISYDRENFVAGREDFDRSEKSCEKIWKASGG